MINNNESVEAYQWQAANSTWQQIGQVVDAVGSGRKQLYEGQEYDYVFDVDVSEGMPPLKLPYNVSGELKSDRSTDIQRTLGLQRSASSTGMTSLAAMLSRSSTLFTRTLAVSSLERAAATTSTPTLAPPATPEVVFRREAALAGASRPTHSLVALATPAVASLPAVRAALAEQTPSPAPRRTRALRRPRQARSCRLRRT